MVRRAEDAALAVDPATVYPVKPPRRIALAGALAVALAILLIFFNALGWLEAIWYFLLGNWDSTIVSALGLIIFIVAFHN